MKRNEGTVYTIEIHTTRFRMQTNELKGQKLDQNSVLDELRSWDISNSSY